jgi:hypothetical protein
MKMKNRELATAGCGLLSQHEKSTRRKCQMRNKNTAAPRAEIMAAAERMTSTTETPDPLPPLAWVN